MGVQGLWQLLSSVGKPVPLESLDGKILAVDVSVWLHQLSKGMRDSNGNPLPNAHLQGLFSRICKLLYYRIKPVFVFDGGIQTLKKHTLASRRSKREDAERSSRLMQQKILTNLIRSQALEEAYGIEGRLYLPPAPKNPPKGDTDVMFHLPPIPESSEVLLLQKSMQDDGELQQHLEDEYVDIGSIDVECEDFRALPLHIQHEVITDIKQRRKDHNLSRIVELPDDSKDFSNFQMAKLVKHNKLNIRLDELRKELNQKQTKALSKYYGNLSNVDEISSQRIVSDDAAHYILVKRNLQKNKEISKKNKEVSKKNMGQKNNGLETIFENADSIVDNLLNDVDKTVDYNLAHNNSTFMDTLAMNKTKKLDKDSNRNTLEKNPQEIDTSLKRNRLRKQRYRSIIETESGSPSDTITIDTTSESSDDVEDFYGVVLDSTPEVVNLQVAIEASLKDQNGHVSHSRCSDTKSFIPCKKKFDQKSVCDATETIENNDILGGAVENISVAVEPVAVKHANRILKRKIVGNNSDEVENIETGKKVKIVKSNNDEDICEDKQNSLGSPSEDNMETSDSDDDFIEVKMDLKNVREDSLFPASLFDMANTIGDDIVSAKELDELKVGTQKPIKPNAPVSIYRETKSKNGQGTVGLIEIIDNDTSASSSSSDILEIAEEMETHMGGASLEIDIAKSDNIFDTDVSYSDINESTEKRNKCYEGEEKADACTLSYKMSQNTNAEPSIENHKLIAGVFMQNLKKQTYASSLSEIVGDKTSLQSDKGVNRGMDIMVSELDNKCMEGADDISILTHSDSLAHAVAENKKLAHTVTDGQNLETSPRGVVDLVKQFKSLNENSVRALRDNLNYETRQLRQEQGRHERLAVGITDQMYTDAQELLRLFGIPYVVSPTEAEAQCAYLEIMKMTQGTITDDSDIWLFGGKCVFKNFFNQAKHVECFKDVNITSQLGLVRESLINIALLCGSDYTEGIRGVGPVIAMEILAEFPGEGIEGLNRFRSWWDDAQKQIKIPVNESKLLAKLRTLDIRSDFPNSQVVEAYLSPAVDDSTEKFSWSLPDLDELRYFAGTRLGWNAAKTDELLLPVLKRLNEKKAQRSITAFFQPEVYMQPAKMKSKRLQNVVNKFTNPSVSAENSTAEVTIKSQSEAKPNRKHLKRALKVAMSDIGVTNNAESLINDFECATTCSEQLGLAQGSGFECKERSQMYNVKDLELSEASLFRKDLLGENDSLMLNVDEMHISESSSSNSESESDGKAVYKAELNVQEILNLEMGFSITDFAQASKTVEMGLKVGDSNVQGTNTKKNKSSAFENVCSGNEDAQQAENAVANKKVVDVPLYDMSEGGFVKEDDSDACQFEVYSNIVEGMYDSKLELCEKKSHVHARFSEENEISVEVDIFEDKLAKRTQNPAKLVKMTQNPAKREKTTQNTSKSKSQKRLEKRLNLTLSSSKRESCCRNLDKSETAKKCLKHGEVLAASAEGVQSQIEDTTIETTDTSSHGQKSCAKAVCEASIYDKKELSCDLQPSASVKKLAQSIYATNALNPIVTGVPWAKKGRRKCTTGKSQKKGKHQKILPLETIVKRPIRKTDLGPRVTFDLSESDSDS